MTRYPAARDVATRQIFSPGHDDTTRSNLLLSSSGLCALEYNSIQFYQIESNRISRRRRRSAPLPTEFHDMTRSGSTRVSNPSGSVKRAEAMTIDTAAAALGNRFSSPSEAENALSGASITSAVALEPPEEHTTLAPGAAARMQELPSLSTAVDIGPGSDPSPKKSARSLWSSVVYAAMVVEDHLAEWFGLNQSKYQWAVDQSLDLQLAGESPLTAASSVAPVERQTQPMSQQAMHRNADEVENV